jgi:hypothetical protein
MIYYLFPRLVHLKFHYDQTDCKWGDAKSIMSNVTMDHDLVRNICSLDPVDAKSTD